MEYSNRLRMAHQMLAIEYCSSENVYRHNDSSGTKLTPPSKPCTDPHWLAQKPAMDAGCSDDEFSDLDGESDHDAASSMCIISQRPMSMRLQLNPTHRAEVPYLLKRASLKKSQPIIADPDDLMDGAMGKSLRCAIENILGNLCSDSFFLNQRS